jgi:hypothetical protein
MIRKISGAAIDTPAARAVCGINANASRTGKLRAPRLRARYTRGTPRGVKQRKLRVPIG